MPCILQAALRAFKFDAVEFVSGNKSDAEPHDTAQEQASSGDPGSAACRELCTRMLDRKTLTAIRHDTEKGLGIGQADFLLKITRLTRGVGVGLRQRGVASTGTHARSQITASIQTDSDPGG
jgi:hypothetical protein